MNEINDSQAGALKTTDISAKLRTIKIISFQNLFENEANWARRLHHFEKHAAITLNPGHNGFLFAHNLINGPSNNLFSPLPLNTFPYSHIKRGKKHHHLRSSRLCDVNLKGNTLGFNAGSCTTNPFFILFFNPNISSAYSTTKNIFVCTVNVYTARKPSARISTVRLNREIEIFIHDSFPIPIPL